MLDYTTAGLSIRGSWLRRPAGVSIPALWSRGLPSEPGSAGAYQDSLGYWYAWFVAGRGAMPAPQVDGCIGIDWGVRTTATTTDPAYDLPCLGYRRRCAAELGGAQPKMSRRYTRGKARSSGYQRAKRAAAKLHHRAASQNKHPGADLGEECGRQPPDHRHPGFQGEVPGQVHSWPPRALMARSARPTRS
jgi:putative transposase